MPNKHTKRTIKDQMQHHFDDAIDPPDVQIDSVGITDEVLETFLTIPFTEAYLEPYKDESDPIRALKEHFEQEGYTVALLPGRAIISKKWNHADIPKARTRRAQRLRPS